MPELIELPVPGKWKTVLTDSGLAAALQLPTYKKERRPSSAPGFSPADLGTGYYHLKPGTLLPAKGASVTVDDAIAKIGNSGTKDPHLHTGGHRLDTTGFGRVVPLRFSGLTDDQGSPATQTPATGKYTS